MYADIRATANKFRLNATHDPTVLLDVDYFGDSATTKSSKAPYSNLQGLLEMYSLTDDIILQLTTYHTWMVIASLIFMIRALAYMHFQPRLGLVTRTMWNALTNVAHFGLIYFLVIAHFSFVGYLSFGESCFDLARSTAEEAGFVLFCSALLSVICCGTRWPS